MSNIIKPVEIKTAAQIVDDLPVPAQPEHYIIRVKNALFDLYEFRYNKIFDFVEFKAVDSKHDFVQFEDVHFNDIWMQFQMNPSFSEKKPSDSLLDRIIKSSFVNDYNGIRDYYSSLVWDGRDHIQALADTITVPHIILDKDTDMSQVWAKLFRRWLYGACACMQGIAPNHVMLLLVSPQQGMGKTTWLNKLCPPELNPVYRFTGHINPELTDNNTANLLAEKCILNIDDQLDTIFGKDFNKMKSLITIDSITNRKSFRRDSKVRTRIANFVGSVNNEKIFVDNENRRYFTIQTAKINYMHEVDMTQVWAQANAAIKAGERIWFDDSEKKITSLINAHFQRPSPEEEWLQKCFESIEHPDADTKFLMYSEIMSILNLASGLRLFDGKLNIAMKKLQWCDQVSKRVGTDKAPRKVYAVKERFIIDDRGKVKFSFEDEIKAEL